MSVMCPMDSGWLKGLTWVDYLEQVLITSITPSEQKMVSLVVRFGELGVKFQVSHSSESCEVFLSKSLFGQSSQEPRAQQFILGAQPLTLDWLRGFIEACCLAQVRGDCEWLHQAGGFSPSVQMMGRWCVDSTSMMDKWAQLNQLDVFEWKPIQSDIHMACFDMDSTVIQMEVMDELAVAAGVGEQVAEITERSMRGELDFVGSFTARLALLNGLSESKLEGVWRAIKLTEGADWLMGKLKSAKIKRVLMTGGFMFFAKRLEAQLDLDAVYANDLEVQDGKITGLSKGEVMDGSGKADRLKAYAQQVKCDESQAMAVGDGANDIPMIKLSGLGIGFHPKPLTAEACDQVIEFGGLDRVWWLLCAMKKKVP